MRAPAQVRAILLGDSRLSHDGRRSSCENTTVPRRSVLLDPPTVAVAAPARVADVGGARVPAFDGLVEHYSWMNSRSVDPPLQVRP